MVKLSSTYPFNSFVERHGIVQLVSRTVVKSSLLLSLVGYPGLFGLGWAGLLCCAVYPGR
jgi:hypothetical protein